MRIWIPTIRSGSGSDVFSERLAAGLNAAGMHASITWFAHRYEAVPGLLSRVNPPMGTNIIHANSANAFAFKRAGIALVATEFHHLHDPDFRRFKSFGQHLYHRYVVGPSLHRSYASADAITAISQFTAAVVTRVAQVSVNQVSPMWINSDVFKPAPAQALTADRAFRLLFIGNRSPRKGGDVIPALARMLGAGFEIRCVTGLRRQVSAQHRANIRVLGMLDSQELIREYQGCDAVLIPSRYEGFGLVALEAMSCAKPVVGFRCGGVAEVLGEICGELLCPVDDLDALAVACKTLATSADLARRLGEAGRQRAINEFSEAPAVSSIIALYRSLASGCAEASASPRAPARPGPADS